MGRGNTWAGVRGGSIIGLNKVACETSENCKALYNLKNHSVLNRVCISTYLDLFFSSVF